ncbi:mucin-3B-like [Ruditapes philippinarum]|uniref:mucin-3B-like n=1 Tax=Ruditapes philippinarum TaxID=129788 RepID=UPI00295AACF8|nr:mucin-3B-like [Ruditapes philippinarum]
MTFLPGLTLLVLIVAAVEVHGQACPEGVNVAKMCVPGTYSGERVLIDTASYDPAVSNCSCTFGTNSSVMKLVTYVAPNYPECNSAIRLYSSSGNSIRFQCLMSGTYLDTSQYNAGVATFETYSDLYDKNYCLVLEIAGRIDDTVTVSCTADIEEEFSSTTPSSVQDNSNVINDVIIESNSTNADVSMNYSTTANEMSSPSMDNTATTDQTPQQTTQQTTETAEVISTMPATVASLIRSENITTNAAGLAIDITDATLKSMEKISKVTITGAISTDATSRASAINATVADIAYESTTAGTISTDRALSVDSTVRSVITETIPAASHAEVVPSEAVSVVSGADLSMRFSGDINTVNNSSGDLSLSSNASFTPHDLDIVFTSSADNSTNNTNYTSHIDSVDNLHSLYDNSISDISETKTQGDLTTLLTGTVLFNRGGSGLSKTIQNIGSVQADILNDRMVVQESTTTYKPETTTRVPISNSVNSNEISNSLNSNTDLFLKSDVTGTTLPVDISNSFNMGAGASVESDIFSMSSNSSDANDSNYSLKFPALDPVMILSNQSTENTTDDLTSSYAYKTHNENDTLILNINLNSFVNNKSISSIETNAVNNSVMNIQQFDNHSNNFAVTLESSTFQSNATDDTLLSTEVTNNALRTSPYTTNEARLIMESSEPIDIIANIPMKIPYVTENTTLPMSSDFIVQNENKTINESKQDSGNSVVNVTSNELYPTTLPGFQFEMTDPTVNNRSQELLQEMVNEQNNQTLHSDVETNVHILMESSTVGSLANHMKDSNDSLNDTFNGSLNFVSDPLTVLSMGTTPRSLDLIDKEQLSQNATVNDTDASIMDIFTESQASNFSGFENRFTNTGFEKRNTFESSTYKMPVEKNVENRSDIVTDHNSGLIESSNETIPIIDNNNVPLQASHDQSNISMYEVNATESMRSSFDKAYTFFQDKTVDHLSALHENNGTSESYFNQTDTVFDQEAVAFAEKTSLPVDGSDKVTPEKREMNVSNLSITNNISDPYHVNKTDTILDIADAIIDNFTNSHIEDVQNLNNVLYQTKDESVTQRTFVPDATTIADESLSSSETAPILKDAIDSMAFAHRLNGSVPEINVTEETMTQMMEVVTLKADNLTFVHRIDETLSKSEHLPQINLTETSNNVVEQGQYLADETAISHSFDVPENVVTPVQNETNVNNMTIAQRLSESVSEINVTGTTSTQMPDVVTENVDTSNLTFVHNIDETLYKSEHLPQINVTQASSNIIENGSYLADETTRPYSFDVPASLATTVQSETDMNRMTFVHRLSETVSEINVTEITPTQMPDVITEKVDTSNLTFVHRIDETLSKNEYLPKMNLTETSSNAIEQEQYLTAETAASYSFDVPASIATPVTNETDINNMTLVYRLSESISELNVTENTPTQMPDVVMENVNNLTFIHHSDEILSKSEHSPQMNLTQISTNIDQGQYLAGEAATLHSFEFPAIGATSVQSEGDINNFTFVPHQNESTFETNVTDNTQMSDAIKSERVGTFIHDINETLSNVEPLSEKKIMTQTLTNTDEQASFFDTTHTSLSEINLRENTPILIDSEVSQLSFVNRLSETSIQDVATESTPDSITENVNTKFTGLVDTNLLSVARQETSTSISSSSSNLHGTALSDQTTSTDRIVNEYMIDNSIDQHNVLSSTDAMPFDIIQGSVKTTTQKTPNPTTVFIPTTTYTFREDIQTDRYERTTLKPSSTRSISDSFTEKQTTSATDITSNNVEDMIVGEFVKSVHAGIPNNIGSITESSDTAVLPDVLADIEKQIILGIKESTPSVPELFSTSTHKTVENMSTSVPKLTAVNTQDRSGTVNEDIPEPIIPKIPSNEVNNEQVTPKKNLDMVEGKVLVEDTSRTMPDKAGESGMNVFFDTGKSKSSAFDMNNDTYIIVVGAIVGLVVIAVVIGVFCHNGRKRRSEKVNISGNNAEAPNHQNQAFDNEAMNDVPGSTVTQNGGGSPEVNGSSSADAKSEDVRNGNVEL